MTAVRTIPNEHPIPTTSGAIESRISDERNRLASEEQAEQDLAAQRSAPLEAGDDAGLDRIEQAIDACRSRQARVSERIELLEQRLTQAQEREAQAELDAVAARANKAREIGEKLIRTEYAKHATALATVLAKLRAIDDFIEDQNRRLENGGHELVSSSNAIRCKTGRSYTETVRRAVGIGEPEHPHHEAYCQMSIIRYDQDHRETHVMINGESIPRFMEVDVVEKRFDSPDWTPALHKMVVPGAVPAVQGESCPVLWNGERSRATQEAIDAIASEVDGDGVIAKAGKSAARLLAAIVPGTGA